MVLFIGTRLWYMIELRTGTLRDRDQFQLDLDDEKDDSKP